MLDARTPTTREQADAWEVAMPLLEAMYAEFRELSKKKPDGVVSASKITVINRLLEKCREVLDGGSSLAFLDLVDKDAVPQHSDVVLMLSQYSAAMKSFRGAHYGWSGTEDAWSLRAVPRR